MSIFRLLQQWVAVIVLWDFGQCFSIQIKDKLNILIFSFSFTFSAASMLGQIWRNVQFKEQIHFGSSRNHFQDTWVLSVLLLTAEGTVKLLNVRVLSPSWGELCKPCHSQLLLIREKSKIRPIHSMAFAFLFLLCYIYLVSALVSKNLSVAWLDTMHV